MGFEDEIKIDSKLLDEMRALAVLNNIERPRVALPITVRNPYYPNTGNMDLFNFREVYHISSEYLSICLSI